jgi:hypothetical protein
MKGLRYPTAVGLLAVAATAAWAGDERLAPGDPPLTRAVADRKIEYWEWVFQQRLDDRQRDGLRQFQAQEWGRRDPEWKARWIRFLGVWHSAVVAGGTPDRRCDGARRTAVESLIVGESDAVGNWLMARCVPAAPAAVAARADHLEAIRLAALMHRQEQRDQMMRMLSEAQARHHETMMLIIRNIAPSGRYEYNSATGKYDRYVPYR